MIRVLLLASVFCGAVCAQSTGFRDVRWANPGAGSSVLPQRIYYPAQGSGGPDAALLPPPAGGYPVAVFLHGFALIGSSYGELGEAFARAGYVAVHCDTARFSAFTQVADARATLPALQAAGADPTSFLFGAVDLTRVGLIGHSMGGGSTLNVLASGNPGYRAGVSLAGVDPGATAVGSITEPVLLIHGEGDAIVPWRTSAERVYGSLTLFDDAKVLNLFDASCDHSNVAGLFLASATQRQVWELCAERAIGWFDAYVVGRSVGVRKVVGSVAQAEPRLAQLRAAVTTPLLWSPVIRRLGTMGELAVWADAGQGGSAAVLASTGTGRITTPFGDLLLDPAGLTTLGIGPVDAAGLFDFLIRIPNDPLLLGARIPLQGIGQNRFGRFRLTGANQLELLR